MKKLFNSKKILILSVIILLVSSIGVIAYAQIQNFSDNKIEVTCEARVDSASVGDGVYFDFTVKNITDDYNVYIESIHDVQSGKSLFCNMEILPNTEESNIVFYSVLEQQNFDVDYNFNVNYSFVSVTQDNTLDISDINLASILVNTRDAAFVAVSDRIALEGGYVNTPTPTPTLAPTQEQAEDEIIFENNKCDFSVDVSSTIIPKYTDQSLYSVEKLNDNDITTYWIPKNHNGVGEAITFSFEDNKKAQINNIKIYGGSGKSYISYYNNNRAKDISIYFDGVLKGTVTLSDVQNFQNIFFIDGPVASEVKIVFDSVYPSSQYDGVDEMGDLTISEVSIDANLETE